MNLDKFLDRILELLINPAKQWTLILNEGTQELHIYRYIAMHILPIIILNVGAYFAGAALVGIKAPGATNGTYLTPITAFFISLLMIATYIGVVFVGSKIISLIASSFDSHVNETNAFKLTAFSMYPLFIFGSLHFIPGLRIGTLAGCYGIYLLYTGFPILAATPAEKSAGYTLVVSLAIIGMLALAFSLINTITGVAPTFRVGL
ncbi:hypothetical protein TI05_08200 [Achromatium sp. WMS3]|nr:hypothetical protein TI05_08200 [Achromatium sp. WMS3]